uniref:Uncharacterized protein n=1 Tax=Acrobeloides nanus TaxID=290746 RepID=A0A914DV57_9BILA
MDKLGNFSKTLKTHYHELPAEVRSNVTEQNISNAAEKIVPENIKNNEVYKGHSKDAFKAASDAAAELNKD